MKKITVLITMVLLLISSLSGCAKQNDGIYLISRENGSGTRGAFIELFGIEEKDETGAKIDRTSSKAEITNSTAVMMTTVSGNKNAIGYISLGSLNKTVKALKIDGSVPSVENIKNGSYKISRPFNIAVKENLNELTKDFVDFILSAEGQAVVEKKGYIKIENPASYSASGKSGKIKIAGSTSIGPLMEVLKEEYIKLNPEVTIEIQQNDSSTGIRSADEGICDIGMASRELKESELKNGLTSITIATDGIAVIVNNENEIENLTSEQIKAVYTEEIKNWNEFK